MKPVYSRRARADLDHISDYYTSTASLVIANAVGRRLADVIERFCRAPDSAPRISQRSQIRVVAVIRYPYRIFYRQRSDDTIDILHIRHTSRPQ